MIAMSSSRKLFFGVLIAKIIFVFVFVGVFGEARLIWSDSNAYLDIGRNIFSGHGFSSASGEPPMYTPNTVRTPLYPFLIGFFDKFVPHGLIAVSLLQAVLAAFAAVLIYQLALRFLSPLLALGMALAASFEPLTSVIHILIMPETVLLVFILLFAISFLRYLDERNIADLLYSALWLGAATMTKPVALYLFVIPLLFLIKDYIFSVEGNEKRNNYFLRIPIFLGIIIILLLPWMTRNYVSTGIVGVTTDDAANICGWTLSGILATKHRLDSSNFDMLYAHPEYQEQMKRCTSTSAALKLFITEYPIDFVKTMIISSIAMLTNDGYSAFFEKAPAEEIRLKEWKAPVKIHHNYLTPAVFTNRDWPARLNASIKELQPYELAVVAAGKSFWLLTFFFAFFGAWQLAVKRRSHHALFLLLVIAYFVAAAITTNAYGVGARLRFPINSLLLLFAAHYLFNHVFRSSLHLFKNAPDVFSNNGKR